MLRPLTTIFAIVALSLHHASAQDFQSMIERTTPLKTHSIAPPYVDSDLQNRWWDFGADTVINTNKHIRLTQDRPSQTGWLWSRIPLGVPNWQMEIEFKVDGKAHNLHGDGFAIWLSRERGLSGPVFGSVDEFTGLGIFFDTYANARHSYQWPRISAMLGDGKTKSDRDHDNAGTELAGCSENFRRRDTPTRARLTYLKGRGLELQLQTKAEGEWTTCFVSADVLLPESPFLGFSALTGDVSDDHDIIAVQTYSALLRSEFASGGQQPMVAQDASRPIMNAQRPKSRGRGGAASWFLFLLKLIGVGAFIAFAVAAYRTYDAQKRSKRAW